jgi:putative tryptophan/tyrosine transport system substrate-binding protein
MIVKHEDRRGCILKGANPTEPRLSVLTRYEFAINLKIAKAPGLGVPLSLLATADKVID